MIDRYKPFQSSLIKLENISEFEAVQRFVSKVEVDLITNKLKITYMFTRP